MITLSPLGCSGSVVRMHYARSATAWTHEERCPRFSCKQKGDRRGSNPRPSGPQPDALPTELRSPGDPEILPVRTERAILAPRLTMDDGRRPGVHSRHVRRSYERQAACWLRCPGTKPSSVARRTFIPVSYPRFQRPRQRSVYGDGTHASPSGGFLYLIAGWGTEGRALDQVR